MSKRLKCMHPSCGVICDEDKARAARAVHAAISGRAGGWGCRRYWAAYMCTFRTLGVQCEGTLGSAGKCAPRLRRAPRLSAVPRLLGPQVKRLLKNNRPVLQKYEQSLLGECAGGRKLQS